MKGTFVVVDGLDGVGKGVFIDTFVRQAKADGKRIFDVHEFWSMNDSHPSPEDIIGKYDVALTSEPTFSKLGRYIRFVMIANNDQYFTPQEIAQAYAEDRMGLYQELVLPLLDAGIDIYQSRSLSTSLVYQHQSAIDEGMEFSAADILAIKGNAYCFSHPMTHLVIPTIKNVDELMRRLAGREKDDDCTFENSEFQKKLKPHYESTELRTLFENNGTKVTYLDASISLESSKQQAKEFYTQNLKK
ncbi:hypothetical protein HQ489_06200 [Candidatus Woesearchaeota archaeon]|nr:hypothetical protein [Candidatus Woesearchaeota archaeon]